MACIQLLLELRTWPSICSCWLKFVHAWKYQTRVEMANTLAYYTMVLIPP
jgi:hypothetical protein